MLDKIKKLTTLLFLSIFLFSSLEASWITKKSEKTKETIKEEKKWWVDTYISIETIKILYNCVK